MDDDYPRDGNCHEGSGCPMNGEYLGQTDRQTGSAVQRAAPQQKI